MKVIHLATATAAIAFLGGAAYAQQPQPPAAPTPGSVTGDWNGSHAPSDDRQYQEKARIPLASAPAPDAEAAPPPAEAVAPPPADASAVVPDTGAATGTAANASFTNITVTNGPVPDTPENRQKYGAPLSNAGKRTAAKGN